MEHVLLWSNCQAPIGPHAVPSPHQLVIPRACDLMLADVRQRGWSMFCCGRNANRPSDHMQFHPPRKLVILSVAPHRLFARHRARGAESKDLGDAYSAHAARGLQCMNRCPCPQSVSVFPILSSASMIEKQSTISEIRTAE